MSASMTRRDFVQTSAGLIIAFHLPPRVAPGAAPGRTDTGFAPNAWLRVGADGSVTLTVDKSEMGQGSQTGLAMILAEELEADWSTVRLGPMPENPAGWSRRMSTGGSTAIHTSWDPLRKAGAAAREMLISAAADTWRVDRSALPSPGLAEEAHLRALRGGRRQSPPLSVGLDRRPQKERED